MTRISHVSIQEVEGLVKYIETRIHIDSCFFTPRKLWIFSLTDMFAV